MTRRKMNLRQMAQGIKLVLAGMGVDLKDPNFAGTPERVAKLYREMLSPPRNNWATFPAREAGMVILRNHTVFGLCPHHLMPVELRCFIGYIPGRKTLGISKLARVVEEQLTMPVLQEDLGETVAQALWDEIHPQGVAVVLAGIHGCMRFRGVETTGDIVTSGMRGLFMHSAQTRSEFLTLIQPALGGTR